MFAVKDVLLSDLEELPNLKIGDFILHIELDDLTPEVKEIARKELRETPEVKKQAIAELRDLLRGKDCFPSVRHTIQFDPRYVKSLFHTMYHEILSCV
jgi:hypothetical protein